MDIKVKMVIKRQVIKENEIIETTLDHPDENIKNKKWIAELFVKEFGEKAHIISKNYDSKDIYEISINGEVFNFSFDTTDAGGSIHKRKVGIPFASAKFREAMKSGKNVYVVNLYRPIKEIVNEKIIVDEEKRVWLFPDPLEIYNSNSYINETWNDSSRWFYVDDILKIILNGGIGANRKNNAYSALNESVVDAFENHNLRSRYYLMNKLKDYTHRLLYDDEKKAIANIRRTFRLILLELSSNNQVGSNIKNDGLLIASHISSVSEIKNDDEISFDDKMAQIGDINNGLLIPVGLDKLFDKYYITFTDDWKIILSNEVTTQEVEELCGRSIDGVWIEGKSEESINYLRKHRERAFRKRDYN